MSARADKVLVAMAEDELDLLLVSNLVNVRWLTGFTGSNAAAVLGPDGTRRFLTDFRYLSQSEAEVDDEWTREIATDLLKQGAEGLPPGRQLRLGFEDRTVSFFEHGRLAELVAEGVELVGAGQLVEKLRMVKDPDELDKIRAASQLADAALEEILAEGIIGYTERDVALRLEFAMRRRGAEGISFDSIVASAEHGALPHAEPRDVPIAEGKLVTIDWGAVLDGYASDCTRTFATGELDPRDREIYELVLDAQLAALDAVKPGPLGKEVDAVAREVIEAAGHAEHFGHGLGHGVGLEVHEGPRLSKQGEQALEAGMVVTVEPGVYVPGAAGVRIEDLVFVTEDGADVVTTLPKELRTVF